MTPEEKLLWAIFGPGELVKERNMQIEKYNRRVFQVEAVQVTEENIEEVAQWCRGEVKSTDEPITRFIEGDVAMPLNERQKKAFVGDWVVRRNNTFKFFQDRGFKKTFEYLLTETEKIEPDTPLPIETVHVVTEKEHPGGVPRVNDLLPRDADPS